MLLINASGTRLRTDEFGGLDLAPGETCELDDGYCRSRLAPNGSRIPSIVERVACGLVPCTAEARAKWGKEVDPPPPPPVESVMARLEEDGVPPAVAALAATGAIEPPRKRGPRKAGR